MPLLVWRSAFDAMRLNSIRPFAQSGFRQCLAAKQATTPQIQLFYYTESKLFPQRLCSVLPRDVNFPG